MKFAFWTLCTLDAIVAAVFLYFFAIGIGDGTVSSVNIVLWLIILALLGAILGGSFLLRAKGLGVLALCLLSLIALPALVLVLVMGSALIFNPRWN